MPQPTEVIIRPSAQILRLSCGLCGDTKDLTFFVEEDGIHVIIGDSTDLSLDEDGIGATNYTSVVHLII